MAGPTSYISILGTRKVVAIRGNHLKLESDLDNKNVRINSRNFVDATAGMVGVQIKPSRTVTGTGDLTGLEVSPRNQNGISGNSLTAIKADPVLKSVATLTGSLKAVECNLDLGSPVIAGDISAFSAFLQLVTAANVTGNIIPFLIRAPDTAQWTHLMELEAGNSVIANDVETGTSGTKRGWLLIEVEGNDRYIRLYDAGT